MDKIPIVEYKGTQLFRDEEMIARKNVSQQEFENLLGVENAFKIINACNNGAEKSKNTISKKLFSKESFVKIGKTIFLKNIDFRSSISEV